MRLIVVSVLTLVISFICFLTIKFWGQSLVYTEYKHPMLQPTVTPVEFYKPSYAQLDSEIAGEHDLYLDLSITFDQKLVIPRRAWVSTEKPLRLFKYDEVKNDVILFSEIAPKLKNRKLILNLIENAQAVHESFMHEMKQIGFEKGENFIVTSPYEAPVKALKEIAPALVYGSSQPEILKIVAMQSMYLLEAASFRADVIIHPLKLRGHEFFTEELKAELKKRHKKMIIGPVNSEEESTAARQIEPLGIIISVD